MEVHLMLPRTHGGRCPGHAQLVALLVHRYPILLHSSRVSKCIRRPQMHITAAQCHPDISDCHDAKRVRLHGVGDWALPGADI